MATGSSGMVESPGSAPLRSALLTFLIADVRGYTRFTAERGDEAAARLAGRFAAIAREIAAARDGEVIELRGDEALAVFPSARQALHAALDLQRRCALEVVADSSLALNVGIGLDAGEAIPVEGGYRGGALNLAARLCGIAGSGEVFASEGVVHLARKTDGIAFVDRGEVMLKGLTSPVRVIQIAPRGELPTELPPLQPILVTHPTNLPDEPTPFIGRERETVQIAGLLQDPHIRMVTLTGPGGTGKTRLGLQVGATLLHDFQDGVFFVSLASLADPILVPSAIAEALSVQEGAGKDLLATLTDHLKEKHLLLVLDNYEHLLEASAVVTQLLDGCRELHVLVTSRIPLHVSREHEHAVSPLSVPDPTQAMDVEALSRYESVALFIERAKAAKDSFTLTTDSASAVAEICSRLDGLPLAIELAAARIKVFPPPALLQRLSSRLTLLTGGAKDRPSRQQTLRNTIEWSHSLLLEQEQSLFARLSVFAGGCTFEAAEAVCDPDGGLDLLEGMTGLVDKSLLRQEGEEELRFAMLETIREYAAEKLLEGGASEGVRAAHGEYFFQLAEEAERGLVGPEQGKWLSRLDQELDNLRGALRWFLDHGASEQGLCLGTALFRFWYSRGYYSEGQRWLEEGVAGERVASELRAKALWSLGTFAEAQGDWARATQLLEEALGLFWELGDRRGVARALNMLGNMTYEQGRYERATSLFEESLRLARELGDRRQSGAALGNLGWVALEQGALARAKDRLEEALETDRAVGDVQNVAVTLNLLGEVAFHEGNFTEAEVQSRAGLAVARELGAKRWLVRCVANLGAVARKQGKLEQAHELVREGLVLARELGDQVSTLQLLGSMAALLVARGELERAAGLKGAETGLRERLSMPLPPVYQAESEETLTQARELLGGEGFTRAWEAGRTMSLDEAVTIALGEDRQVA